MLSGGQSTNFELFFNFIFAIQRLSLCLIIFFTRLVTRRFPRVLRITYKYLTNVSSLLNLFVRLLSLAKLSESAILRLIKDRG
jgi:hypothetical protein